MMKKFIIIFLLMGIAQLNAQTHYNRKITTDFKIWLENNESFILKTIKNDIKKINGELSSNKFLFSKNVFPFPSLYKNYILHNITVLKFFLILDNIHSFLQKKLSYTKIINLQKKLTTLKKRIGADKMRLIHTYTQWFASLNPDKEEITSILLYLINEGLPKNILKKAFKQKALYSQKDEKTNKIDFPVESSSNQEDDIFNIFEY